MVDRSFEQLTTQFIFWEWGASIQNKGTWALRRGPTRFILVRVKSELSSTLISVCNLPYTLRLIFSWFRSVSTCLLDDLVPSTNWPSSWSRVFQFRTYFVHRPSILLVVCRAHFFSHTCPSSDLFFTFFCNLHLGYYYLR